MIRKMYSDEEGEEEVVVVVVAVFRIEILDLESFLPFDSWGNLFFSSFVGCDVIRSAKRLFLSLLYPDDVVLLCETCANQWTKYSTGGKGN
jgi:hypothetical protein